MPKDERSVDLDAKLVLDLALQMRRESPGRSMEVCVMQAARELAHLDRALRGGLTATLAHDDVEEDDGEDPWAREPYAPRPSETITVIGSLARGVLAVTIG
jgi:hypothetical protein